MRILHYLGRGIAHERRKLPCQDVIGYECFENGHRVMALSDGAGSSRYALEAAQANVAAVLEFFRMTDPAAFAAMPPAERARAIIAACLARLMTLREGRGELYARDICATLLFAVYDGAVMTIGHLGDGMILVQDAAGETLCCSAPEIHPSDQRSTYFTISPEAAAHLRIRSFTAGQAATVLLTSDGACGMFENRGGGRAQATAEELLGYVRGGMICDNGDLADVLGQMAEIPSERLDDWSVLIGSAAIHGENPGVSEPVSMLSEVYQNTLGRE